MTQGNASLRGRRNFLKCSALTAAGMLMSGGMSRADPAKTPLPLIAIEEHFLTPDILRRWTRMLASDESGDPGFHGVYAPLLRVGAGSALVRNLLEVGAERIQMMDRAGISLQVLSLTSPGVQVFAEREAVECARQANDTLAEIIAAHPWRFAGLGAFAPQNVAASVREIERCAHQLRFAGMLINSHTRGEYLDAAKFRPLFEALEALELPLYLHPQTPSQQMVAPYLEYGLLGPALGFSAETSLHAARLIYSGLIEDFPRLKIIMGHLGEGIPWWLARMDSRYKLTVSLAPPGRKPRDLKLPSEYFKSNFYVTTSGMTDSRHLVFTTSLLGADHVLFATDYPYEAISPAVDMLQRAAISQEDRLKVACGNAQQLFRLDQQLAVR